METGYLLLSNGYRIGLPEDLKILGYWNIKSYKDEIVEVFIPDSVVLIEDSCFQSAAKLERVRFSKEGTSDLRMIGRSAFDDCAVLHEIAFPDSLRHIDTSAFAQTALTSVDLSETDAVHIGDCAFAACSQLTNVKLPNSLKAISNGCFAHCRQLSKIAFHATPVFVDQDAFECCDELHIVEGVDNPEFMHIVKDGNSAFLAALNG